METQTISAASQSGKTRQSAGMEKAAPSRPGQFSQILKRAESSRQERSITPASATLSRPVQPRSSFFMQNMSIEQRRSAVEEKGFSARPAAMERVSASMAVQAGRSKEAGAEHSHPPGLALGSTLHKPYASGHEFETNGAAQKNRVKEAINDSAELKVLIHDFMHRTMNLELLDLSDYPVIRYYSTGEPVTRESKAYFSDMLHSVREKRNQLYETEVLKGTSDLELLKKLIDFSDGLPDRFKNMTNW
ncbi:hypothetical protein MQC82_02545 [Pseudomonas viridiflava]|uniref:hypothetical protein n=1 Tax=Pseudomonas viridiflava TaxID=33069 RepID=UPI001F619EDA|nr:hypothetical protein [Pseudomonas viridiflava]MCI3908435.1 hypothetical protein [Pseudomonas viridiflava]